MGKDAGIARKQALGMDEVMGIYLKSMKLTAGLNTRRIFEAWDQVSGASSYTSRKFFRDGKLYVTMTSSVARSTLSFQKDGLIAGINDILRRDPLFTKDDPTVSYVKELVLK